jgi:uncharacterized membrane protein YczE
MRARMAVAVVLAAALLTAPVAVYAQDVGSIVKTLGVGVAVKMFAPQLNDFINNLMRSKNVQTNLTTKVVPILSLSLGIGAPGRATIGAAQVAGSRAAVAKVQAVASLDGNFSNVFQVKALIPVDSLEPWNGLHRVTGVGVSAIIDLRI